MRQRIKQHITRKKKGGILKRNANLTTWQSVYKMIRVTNATITKIAFTSLKGFIFRLDVPKTPENSEFLGFNEKLTAIDKPIYSLVLKFSVIMNQADVRLPGLVIPGDVMDDGRPAEYSDYNARGARIVVPGRAKLSESLNDFEAEADTQQDIYIKTISPVGRPADLAVVDFSTFNADAAKVLLKQLRRMPQAAGTSKSSIVATQEMLDYLISNVNASQSLGLITMELAKSDFVPLWQVPRGTNPYTYDCTYALAQMITVFIKSKKMNYDCHGGNILAATSEPNGELLENRGVLIDFGRAITLDKRDPFPSDNTVIKAIYKKITGNNFDSDRAEVVSYIAGDFIPGGRGVNPNPLERIRRILKFMACSDYATNNHLFDISKPQMSLFLKSVYGSSFSDDWEAQPPDFEITSRSRPHLERILSTVVALNTDPQKVNIASVAAVQERIRKGRLFKITQGTSYDRSNVDDWVAAETASGAAGGGEVLVQKGEKTYICDILDKTCSVIGVAAGAAAGYGLRSQGADIQTTTGVALATGAAVGYGLRNRIKKWSGHGGKPKRKTIRKNKKSNKTRRH
jgi:hypothetical protein